MKWITHKAVALGAAYLMGMPPEGLAGVLVGSVLPDVLDQGLARLLVFRHKAFNRVHRGPTHWFGWWLALFAAGCFQLQQSPALPGITWLLLGTGFGALAHVLLDMATEMGVPMVPWSKKPMLSLKLCSTGSLKEYAFLACFLAAFSFLVRDDLLRLLGQIRRHLH